MNVNIDIQYFCPIPKSNQDSFIEILNVLFGQQVLMFPELLTAIWIVPENQIPIYVNKIINTFHGTGLSYHPGDYTPRGVAVPLENDGKAYGFILFDERLLKLDNMVQNYYHPEVLSTIIEEILHLQLYSIRWKLMGHIVAPKHIYQCKTDFYRIASQMHDEYAVIRSKSLILKSLFSVRDAEGNLVPLEISYGESLNSKLSQAIKKLEETIISAAKGITPIDQSSTRILNEIYRDILEPLSRNAAYITALPQGQHPNNNAFLNDFYSETVRTYWENIEKQLQISFDSEFVKLQSALDEIVNQIEALLLELGVSYKELNDGSCWVDFRTNFFDVKSSRED